MMQRTNQSATSLVDFVWFHEVGISLRDRFCGCTRTLRMTLSTVIITFLCVSRFVYFVTIISVSRPIYGRVRPERICECISSDVRMFLACVAVIIS